MGLSEDIINIYLTAIENSELNPKPQRGAYHRVTDSQPGSKLQELLTNAELELHLLWVLDSRPLVA